MKGHKESGCIAHETRRADNQNGRLGVNARCCGPHCTLPDAEVVRSTINNVPLPRLVHARGP